MREARTPARRSSSRERLDRYTLQLQEHGLESVEREVRWLTELLETERRNSGPAPPSSATGTSTAGKPLTTSTTPTPQKTEEHHRHE